MRRTSPRGSRRPNGYVLMEALAALAVLGVGGIALIGAANGCMRAVYRQTNETVRILEERNARTAEELEDLAPQ